MQHMSTLIVKIASGTDDLERCNQGWMASVAALSAGVTVSVWLAGDAVLFAKPGFAEGVVLRGAQSFAEAVRTVLAEGRLTACTQCLNRRGLQQADLLPGVHVGGAMGFIEEVMADGVKALVY